MSVPWLISWEGIQLNIWHKDNPAGLHSNLIIYSQRDMKCDHLCHNFWFQQVDHHGWATENGESDREHGVIVQLSLK